MQCPVCKSESSWENVDKYRYKPEGMSLCNECGFVTYPERKNLEDYYKDDYRNCPSVNNLYAGTRKLHYHHSFLGEYLKELSTKKDVSVYEIGAAYGLTLDWIRQTLPDITVGGTELTKTFVNNCLHEFGIELTNEIDLTKKHDLLISYKVHEHIPNPVDELLKYRKLLKDDGRLYISVPIWFETMENSGLGGFNLEYYYHPDHINVWTRDMFEALLGHCGFEIEKKNYITYGCTYLCKRVDRSLKTFKNHWGLTSLEINKKHVKESLEPILKASELFDRKKFDDAIKEYKGFPLAYIHKYEFNRASADKEGFEYIKENYINPAITACPTSFEIIMFVADIYMRYDKYKEAILLLNKALEMRSNNERALLGIGICYQKLKKPIEALKAFRHLRNVSPSSYGEAVTRCYYIQSKLTKENVNEKASV